MRRSRTISGIFLIIILTGLSGCTKKKEISGKAFVPKEVLVNILVDMHLMDAMSNSRRFQLRYDADSMDLIGPILDKYNITYAMYDTTMAEYSRYPELFDQVYNEVLIKLNVMLDENDKSESQ